MKRFGLAGVIFAAVVASGCGPSSSYLRQASVGQTGCPADELVVSDSHSNGFGWSWVSTCRGHRFLCSSTDTGKNDQEYGCKEEVKQAEPKPAK